MLLISRARKQDLPAIHELMRLYGSKMQVGSEHLNNRDIALQARNANGELVGFVWAGLMAQNTLAYIDKVAIRPDYAKQGVSQLLYHELFKLGARRGVKEVFGIIRQDQYHDKAAVNALKMAFGADSLPYTYVRAQMAHVQAELNILGVA